MKTSPLLNLALAGALAGALAASASFAGAESAPATLTVTGEATVARAPDTATISIGVATAAESASEAMSGNSVAMAAVSARLKEAGIAGADMQTSGLSLAPDWSQPGAEDAAARIAGYTATNGLRVTVRSLDDLGAVLDAAIADGANTLDGLGFSLADPRPALDEARRAAVADARARAEVIADAAGLRLGRVISITDGGGYPAPVAYRSVAMEAAVPVEQGEVSYSASVTFVWALEQ